MFNVYPFAARRPERNGRHFHMHFPEGEFRILITIVTLIVPKGPVGNNTQFLKVTALYRSVDKPYLSQWWPCLLMYSCLRNVHTYTRTWISDLHTRQPCGYLFNEIFENEKWVNCFLPFCFQTCVFWRFFYAYQMPMFNQIKGKQQKNICRSK